MQFYNRSLYIDFLNNLKIFIDFYKFNTYDLHGTLCAFLTLAFKSLFNKNKEKPCFRAELSNSYILYRKN